MFKQIKNEELTHYLLFSLGYDLCQVNQYISKLFENVGSLVYEEAPETEKYNFMITGVQSELGEKLEFQQVLLGLNRNHHHKKHCLIYPFTIMSK